MEGTRHESSHAAGVREGAARTLAQTTCLVLGVVLVAVGILGFFFGGSNFEVGNQLRGEDFIVFEVNGWHNIVHIATGAFLLLMSPKAKSAVTGLIVFGVVYVVVTVWGFVDGNDIIELVTINDADNFLHLALAAVALLVAFSAGGLAASSRRAAH